MQNWRSKSIRVYYAVTLAPLQRGLILFLFAFCGEAFAVNESLRLRLEQWIEPTDSKQSAKPILISNCQIADPTSTRQQIEQWFYEPVWTQQQGRLSPTGASLLSHLRSADDLGLNPLDYHVNCIESLEQEASDQTDSGLQNDLEILLTDAFVRFLTHNRSGRLNPLVVHPEWFIKGRIKPAFETVARAPNPDSLDTLLRESEPDYPEYRALKSELKRLKNAAPFEQRIKSKLKPRMDHPDVAILSSQLNHLGYLKDHNETTIYTSTIETAVKRFQVISKLEADGVVGPDTVKALENALHGSADTIRVNLERLRWLPEQYGDRYILVDIAGYQMQYWEDSELQLSMRVIVGKAYRKTPIFNQLMRYVVVNPSWDPTYTIATKDLLPKIKTNPNYFTETGMKVFKGWGKDQEHIDPNTIDWHTVSPRSFPYRFRQPPGPANPLGKVKFIFPNEFDVYMHDTNNHSLFEKQELAFSSGCIRLEKPIDLLKLLFSRSAKWPAQRLDSILNSNMETTIPLEKPLPVFLLYKTALLGSGGEVVYRKDIYERDSAVLEALNNSANLSF